MKKRVKLRKGVQYARPLVKKHVNLVIHARPLVKKHVRILVNQSVSLLVKNRVRMLVKRHVKMTNVTNAKPPVRYVTLNRVIAPRISRSSLSI